MLDNRVPQPIPLPTPRARSVPTIRVTLHGSTEQMVINESAFNPAIHQKVDPAPPPSEDSAELHQDPSLPDEGDAEFPTKIAELTLEQLKSLPIWGRMSAAEKKAAGTKKADIVDAIVTFWELE